MTSDAITIPPAAAGPALLEEGDRLYGDRLWTALPAPQQPEWEDLDLLAEVTFDLADRPALVAAAEVAELRRLLAEVASGRFQVVQAGDCAEDPAECGTGPVARKVALLEALAGVMSMNTLLPTLRVGRMAGQFAKPRSRPTELVDGVELPVYRGHLVNGPEPDARSRRPDPRRLVSGYEAAGRAMDALRERVRQQPPTFATPVWTSHEALLLDYEVPQVRATGTGGRYLASTHWPWIGYRTNQLDGAHVALLASVDNPVAAKVGPGMTADQLLGLCERLDPDREPGRLTLIARMGADAVAEQLTVLAAAVREAGHPVVWLSDPMHGNTVTGPGGLKTRLLETVLREVREFQRAVLDAGAVAGGLHLETTPDDVTECAADARSLGTIGRRYTSLCDPRLNPAQALEVAAVWRAAALLG